MTATPRSTPTYETPQRCHRSGSSGAIPPPVEELTDETYGVLSGATLLLAWKLPTKFARHCDSHRLWHLLHNGSLRREQLRHCAVPRLHPVADLARWCQSIQSAAQPFPGRLRWTPFVGQFFGRSYLGQASMRRRRGAAIHSGLESALGSHPCVALSSYQAPRL